MKKGLLFLFFILFYIVSYSQIKVLSSSKKDISVYPLSYDSLENFKKEPKQYIGQTLFLIPKSESLRQYGYRNIYAHKNNKIWKTTGGYPYDSIASKSFIVLDVVKYDTTRLYSRDMLVLQNKENSDTMYFEFDPYYEHNFPFLVEGYYERLKKSFIGTKYVARKDNLYSNSPDSPMLDLEGNVINNKAGEIWTIEDVVLEDRYYNLNFIMINSQGKRFSTYLSDIERGHFYFYYPLAEANRLKSKYGQSLYLTALKGKAQIGMTKELAEFAWGKPEDVNRTTGSSSREQWVYEGGNYLYFTNGKLTSIQN